MAYQDAIYLVSWDMSMSKCSLVEPLEALFVYKKILRKQKEDSGDCDNNKKQGPQSIAATTNRLRQQQKTIPARLFSFTRVKLKPCRAKLMGSSMTCQGHERSF